MSSEETNVSNSSEEDLPEKEKSAAENETLSPKSETENEVPRRTFLSGAASVGMVGGLAASYGTFGAMACRFLYPSKPTPQRWMFLKNIKEIPLGDSFSYETPSGAKIAVARQGIKGVVEDFVALSSTCPHLGCQVHWEGKNNQFFCPCHNGAFDAKGKGISGPPADAGQSLPEYPLKIENGLLYIKIPADTRAASADLNEANQVALNDSCNSLPQESNHNCQHDSRSC